MAQPGWTHALRQHGDVFLEWARRQSTLDKRGAILAQCLRDILLTRVSNRQAADAIWNAAPYVLTRCNEQSTYALPFAAEAYAWLHFLDRYARTWRAFEVMVALRSLPLAKNGVNVLDIGTGPGPSAFAAHDFYQTMVAFAQAEGAPAFKQPSNVSCVEYDDSANQLRARIVAAISETASASPGVVGIGAYLRDFSTLSLANERRRGFQAFRRAEDEYYDEIRSEWTSDLVYTPEEANEAAQAMHRYRLFIFSNFLTTVGTVQAYRSNLIELFAAARVKEFETLLQRI